MNSVIAQQVALNNALVAPEDRVNIGKCNMRIDPTKTQKEATYQVVLDTLSLSPCYNAFLITTDVPEIYMHQLPNQEFVKPPSHDEMATFIKSLGYKGALESIPDLVTDHLYQPLRTFAGIINRCLSRKTKGLDKLGLSRAQILWGLFYKKNVDFVELIWEDFIYQIDNREINSKRRASTPKKARKWKQAATKPKKTSSVTSDDNIIFDDTDVVPANKPTGRRRQTGV
ncbi:hypothetical protein Tco_0071691 [Tanacetum coccineum]